MAVVNEPGRSCNALHVLCMSELSRVCFSFHSLKRWDKLGLAGVCVAPKRKFQVIFISSNTTVVIYDVELWLAMRTIK